MDPQQVRNYDGLPVINGRGGLGMEVGTVQLRGRKFYFHYPLKDWDAYRCRDPERFRNVLNEVKPVQPGNSFEFRVHFRNLSEIELGLLLYCLCLEDNLRHKLGLARALGFGTVRLECQSLLLNRNGDRYTSLNTAATDETGKIVHNVTAFKTAVTAANPEGASFDELVNVRKLKKIMDPSHAPSGLEYPGFHWYAHNHNVPLPLL